VMGIRNNERCPVCGGYMYSDGRGVMRCHRKIEGTCKPMGLPKIRDAVQAEINDLRQRAEKAEAEVERMRGALLFAENTFDEYELKACQPSPGQNEYWGDRWMDVRRTIFEALGGEEE